MSILVVTVKNFSGQLTEIFTSSQKLNKSARRVFVSIEEHDNLINNVWHVCVRVYVVCVCGVCMWHVCVGVRVWCVYVSVWCVCRCTCVVCVRVCVSVACVCKH